MRIEEDVKLDFSDVLIRPKRSALESRKDVSLKRSLTFKHSNKTITAIPIMNSNMGTCGTFGVADVLQNYNCLYTIHKFHDTDKWIKKLRSMENKINDYLDHMFFPIGIDNDSYNILHDVNAFLRKELSAEVPNIMIDVANGYSEKFVDHIKRIRDDFPNAVITAGNVVTPDMTEALIFAGADVVKIGVGNGSVCSTRLKAGVGYPQLSAIHACSDAAHGLGGHIISDGGCVHVGDFAKAFGAGADIIMSGSFFAGTNEADCKKTTVSENGKTVTYGVYYGMSSKTAQDKYGTGLKDYRSSEGRTALIPLTGPTETVIKDILGGIRSCCTYVGANKIKELPKRTTFIKVNNTHNTINESNTIGN